MRPGCSLLSCSAVEVSSDSSICKRQRLKEAPSTQRGIYREDSRPSHRLQGRPEPQGPERVKRGHSGHPCSGRLWSCQRDSAPDRHRFLSQTKANKHQMHAVDGGGVNHERRCCLPSHEAAEFSIQNCSCLALRRPKPGLHMETRAAGGFLGAVWGQLPCLNGSPDAPFLPSERQGAVWGGGAQ